MVGRKLRTRALGLMIEYVLVKIHSLGEKNKIASSVALLASGYVRADLDAMEKGKAEWDAVLARVGHLVYICFETLYAVHL